MYNIGHKSIIQFIKIIIVAVFVNPALQSDIQNPSKQKMSHYCTILLSKK